MFRTWNFFSKMIERADLVESNYYVFLRMDWLSRMDLNSNTYFLRTNNVTYSDGLEQIQTWEEEYKHIITF